MRSMTSSRIADASHRVSRIKPIDSSDVYDDFDRKSTITIFLLQTTAATSTYRVKVIKTFKT